jgi:hypothetical protein
MTRDVIARLTYQEADRVGFSITFLQLQQTSAKQTLSVIP